MRVIDVAAGLVFRGGKLLITQRYPDAHLGGLWEFPGGKREPGESFRQCLERELREELGIEIRIGRLIDTVTHAYPEKTVRLLFFWCAWTQHEPEPRGCPAFRWVAAEELTQYTFPAADAVVLKTLLSRHDLWTNNPQ